MAENVDESDRQPSRINDILPEEQKNEINFEELEEQKESSNPQMQNEDANNAFSVLDD